jgi:hypothetical protein
VGPAASGCGVRKPRRPHAAARARHHLQISGGRRKVLGSPDFKYTGEWRSADGAVLEFENEIEGIKINGVDIITFSDDGKITHFKVMVRPLKGINLLHRLMGEQLAKQ